MPPKAQTQKGRAVVLIDVFFASGEAVNQRTTELTVVSWQWQAPSFGIGSEGTAAEACQRNDPESICDVDQRR